MTIIVYHIEHNVLCNNLGQVCLANPLEFLTQDSPGNIRLFSNLDYCVANLLRLLGIDKEGGQKLLSNRRLYLIPENCELFYIPGKIFSLTLGKTSDAPTYSFADCAQYHEMTLVKGGYNADSAIKMCIESQAVGQEVFSALCSLGLSPNTLTSPIKAYQKEVLDNLNLPTVSDMGKATEAAEWAYECSHRQWVEAFKTGHWKMAWDYDISSAYASELAKMPDTRQGKWIKGRARPQDAILGFLRGEVVVNHSLSPVMYEKAATESDRYYTPTGSWSCYMTQAEADFIEAHGIGHLELKDGWWFVPAENITYPYQSVMNYLHEQKESATGIAKGCYKRIMTGCYGKTLESWSDRFGPLFNPVWGATVETNTRLKVAQFCLDALSIGRNPLHVAVDGVLLDYPMPQVPYLSSGLGGWKFSGQAPLIIVSSGILGFSKSRQETDNFALDYDKLKSLILSTPDESCYKLSRPSIVSIPIALQQDRWNELGDVYDLERTIDVTAEQKRYYSAKPKCGAELLNGVYNSEPWDSYLLEEIT